MRVNVWLGISPHISGGLGTASYGLTKGMASLENIEVLFVVPKAWGDEDQTIVRLIGANRVPVAFKKIHFKGFKKGIEKIEIFSKVIPYTDPEDFWKKAGEEIAGYKLLVKTNSQGTVDFSGRYGSNLMEEIYKYSVVASVIAAENEFDIIHAHDWLAYPAGSPPCKYPGNHWLYTFMRPISTEVGEMLIPMFTKLKRRGWMPHQK